MWLVGGQAIENQTQVDASVDPTSVEATKIGDPCFCTIMDGKEDSRGWKPVHIAFKGAGGVMAAFWGRKGGAKQGGGRQSWLLL